MQESAFYKYVNDKSILIINKHGKIKRLYCPFPVIDNKDVISTVTAIATGNDSLIYYKIKGLLYKYSFYSILGD